MRRRLRILLWRYRFVIAAGLITAAVLVTVGELRPDTPGTPVIVAARDLPAGTAIRAEDVTVRPLTPAPRSAVDDAAGLVPIVTIPAGVPVTESMVLGPGLADHAPPGTVLAPVHIEDPSLLTLLRVGDLVDLYQGAADLGGGPAAHVVSRGVRVLAIPSPGDGGLLGLDPTPTAVFFGAIPETDATLFMGASGSAPYRVVVSATTS